MSCFQKIRVLTLALRRRQFKSALEKQCRATGISYVQIPLDMPVRWSSTKVMLEKFYSMRDAITAVMAIQQFDDSLYELNLTHLDWSVAKELLDFFTIFTKTTTYIQADDYPTLNRTLPEYFRLMSRLEEVRDGTGKLFY